MKHYKNARSLTIPDHILATLPVGLVNELTVDGHGISFNSDKSLQMRYIYNCKDYGAGYPLSKYGSWENALTIAMKDQEKLVIQYPNSSRGCSSMKGVFLTCRSRKDRQYMEYYWVVSYYDNQRPKTKVFYCGNDKSITAAKKKHAELTAWYFRRLYCETLDPDMLSFENIKGWQKKKFYG